MRRFRREIGLVVSFSLALSSVGCSPSSMASPEGAVGSIITGVLGAGAGYAVGNEIGKKTENTLLGAGVGAGLGLMAGGLLHEQNLRVAKQRAVVVREAKMISRQQKELDNLREQLSESTQWGGNEVKPWNDRYWGEDSAIPYQGPGHSRP